MAAQIRHLPPRPKPGEWANLFGHNTTKPEECPCQPNRTSSHAARSRGRGGRHQGYDVTINWQHHELPEKISS